MLCYPDLVLQPVQVLDCVGLWSEWCESASEPLDIESAAPRPLRLPSRFGDRASIQRGELVGWLDDLGL